MRSPLADVAFLFLRLGVTGFGGPAAHVAMMEEEVVRRRRWLTAAEFAELLAAAQLMPGPNSTELAIHIGRSRAGPAGLVVAGLCFITPAALIVTALAWGYVRTGALPAAARMLAMLQPVVLAVVAQAVWTLGRATLTARPLVLVAVGAFAAALLGAEELLVLVAAGAAAAVAREGSVPASERAGWAAALPALSPGAGGAAVAAAAAAAGGAALALAPIFLLFLKTGAVLYGSGYVLLAFLRADLVVARGWLTETQLLDAIVVGQLTPGPLFTTATFAGYLLAGPAGAAVATLGIFLPAFLYVAASGRLLPRLRRSAAARAFLRGVAAASLALMAAVTVTLARGTLTGAVPAAIAGAALVLLLRFRVPASALLAGAAVVGLAVGALEAARPAPATLPRGTTRGQLSPVVHRVPVLAARPPAPQPR